MVDHHAERRARAAGIADWFERWMREDALPLWAEAGRDAEGLFYEALRFDGTPDRDRVRRVRVQFRQIYVFSAAKLLGLREDGADIALRAFDATRARAWAPDGKPGWAHLLGPDGAVVDATRDAYDQAFALMALAWAWRATAEPRVKAAVEETLAFVDEDLAARSGGWWEAVRSDAPGRGPALRRQNPHMHALEAMLALYEAFGDRDYLDRARQIFHLFAGRFFDWSDRVVIEYFDLDWRPAPAARQRVEPGHMAEWVYLIREYERLTGERVAAIADPLFERSRALGLDPTRRFLRDELDVSGRPTKNSRRLWPQTEHAKAALTQYRASGDGAALDCAVEAISALREVYLAAEVDGGWRDAFDLDGALVARDMPASTFYHVFGLFALARDLLRRAPPRRLSVERSAAMADAESLRVTPVILAGGVGSRLWPLSTPERPKQFLPLAGGGTLFQETLGRLGEPALFGPAVVVANARHGATIASQAEAAGAPLERLILEPVARNSAPAIAAAAYSVAPETLLLVAPADHLIRETALFHGIVENAAAAAANGAIVTFGVTPTRPETGFGYIRAGAPLGAASAFAVEAFVEKPDLETARSYLASGAYLWNSGMFLFRAGDLRAELERLAPEVSRAAEAAVRDGAETEIAGARALALDEARFAEAPSISIDYAVMEKTERAAVCPAALTWSDIGSWDALADARPADAAGNHAEGAIALIDCRNVFALSEGVKVAAIGLENVVVVTSGDTVLIADRASAQKVREAAKALSEKALAEKAAAEKKA